MLIPTGHEETFHQEQAVPHHQEKQEKGLTSNALHCHMEKWEAEKQEVLHHQQCYICHRCWEIKLRLHLTDEVVREFKVFGDNAQIYATYVMAMLEWGQMHCHYGRRDPVPVLPKWLTMYIGVSKELRTNADLPKKHIQIGHSDVCLNAMGTWLWMADLLQFWADLSGS